MTIASVALIKYCGITVYAWLRIKEFVIVIQVRCGGLNPRSKSGVPNYIVDVSMLTRGNGIFIFWYIRRSGYDREKNEENKMGQLRSNVAVLQAEWHLAF